MPLLSENIYSEIQKTLSLPLNVASSMARDSFLISWVLDGEQERGDITRYLGNLKERYGFFSTFFVSDISNKYYFYDGLLKEISENDGHDVWYYTFINSKKDKDLDVDTNEANEGVLTIFINFRLEDFEGNLLGVVGVGVKLEMIAKQLQQKKDLYQRDIFLVDESGTIQVHSDMNMVEKINLFEEEGINVVATQLMEQVQEPIELTYSSQQGDIFVSSKYISELNWHVIVEQDEKSSLIAAKRSLFLSLLITVGIAACIYLLSNHILNNFKLQMEQLAGTDNLTNVANRRELYKQFKVFEYRRLRYSSQMSIILIDLDRFKDINDTFGHLEGDRVLKEFASRMKQSIRPIDLIVRWGGDEFIILMEADIDEAKLTSDRILKLAQSIHYGQKDNSLSVSIGLARYDNNDNLKTLIGKADKALYVSKHSGRCKATIESSCEMDEPVNFSV